MQNNHPYADMFTETLCWDSAFDMDQIEKRVQLRFPEAPWTSLFGPPSVKLSKAADMTALLPQRVATHVHEDEKEQRNKSF